MSDLEESVARELLTHNGIVVIWEAHIAADAAYRAGNQRAAELLLKIADAAEAILRNQSASSTPDPGPAYIPGVGEAPP